MRALFVPLCPLSILRCRFRHIRTADRAFVERLCLPAGLSPHRATLISRTGFVVCIGRHSKALSLGSLPLPAQPAPSPQPQPPPQPAMERPFYMKPTLGHVLQHLVPHREPNDGPRVGGPHLSVELPVASSIEHPLLRFAGSEDLDVARPIAGRSRTRRSG